MKWIKVGDKKPKPCEDILFTDGKIIYKGWIDSYEPLQDLNFNNEGYNVRSPETWVESENITHWMKLPKLPQS